MGPVIEKKKVRLVKEKGLMGPVTENEQMGSVTEKD